MRWTERETSPRAIVRFRIAFAAVWLAYDVADLAFGGTAVGFLGQTAFEGFRPRGLEANQIALIVCEAGLLSGIRTRWFAAAAFALRSLFAYCFTAENDFLYFIVTAFLLSAADADGPPFGKRRERVRKWPEDALLVQLAWIYLMSGMLKLNAAWLSGDILYVRIRYRAASGWPLAALLERLVDHQAVSVALAVAAVVGELLIAALLFARRGRRTAIALAVCIHAFAGLATDVWFFGASMACQVWALFPARRPDD